MKKLYCLLVGLTLLLSGLLHATEEAFFPLTSWGLNFQSSPKYFKTMAECGINVVGCARPNELKAIRDAGLKAYVFGWKQCSDMDWSNLESFAEERFKQLHADVGNNPAVIGYYLVDEPSSKSFQGIGKMVDIIHRNAPGKLPYISLLPSYAGPNGYGAENFDTYVERFIQECKPDSLVFNFYYLYENTPAIRPDLWGDLETFRQASLRHNLPFRMIVCSVAHFKFRVQTFDSLMLQACIALAYGAKGIEYFMYGTDTIGNWRAAPIDQFGNKTPVWDAMRQTNNYLANIGPKMMKLRSTGIYHIPADATKNQKAPDANSIVKSIPGGKFLVGDFKHEETGEKFVFIVNLDVDNSAYIGDIEFSKQPKEVLLHSGWRKNLVKKFIGFESWLFPGQSALLQVK